ncbi:unnamed protein product [Rotaria sp. Silwood1]|nr:unnamed protein product [Rotaria sp. Silwood1]
MSPPRRESVTDITSFNDNDEQQPFTSPIVSTNTLTSRIDRRKSSIAAIFDDNRRRDEILLKTNRQNLRRLWDKYDVPYIIGEEILYSNRTICELILLICSCRTSAHGPGMCFVLPCIDIIHLVDIRTVSFDVPPQEVLTRDSVTVAVDAVVYYRIFNPTVSIANVENAQESTHLLAQTSLRNVLGTRLLSELLSDRGAVSNLMRECLDDATESWGIKVERVEIKDVRLPKSLQRIMAAEAEAAREARAKIIVSEGEFKSSRALKDAADILAQSPCAMQLRYLQTLNNIATEQNSTIIFPIPVDLFSCFQKHSNLTKIPSDPFILTPTNSDDNNIIVTGKTTSTDI